ncbi:29127_t:CDS:2, partial [Gigaspora margarita]
MAIMQQEVVSQVRLTYNDPNQSTNCNNPGEGIDIEKNGLIYNQELAMTGNVDKIYNLGCFYEEGI